MTKTVVVIPTYNEADNVEAITAALFDLELDTDLHILIVDDNSPDGTSDIIKQLSAERYPEHLHLIHRAGKLGLGTAYITGFNWALDHGADYIIQMDADFSHSPSYIPEMLKHISDSDVVVGSRYVSGGQLDKRWSWWRWFLSWWANAVWTRGILGIRTRDATAGFKCWRRSALQRLGLERIHSNGYVFQVEMAYVAEKLGFRVLEIPIYFEDRRIGQSKMSWPVKIEGATRVFEIRWRHRKIRPLPAPRSAEA